MSKSCREQDCKQWHGVICRGNEFHRIGSFDLSSVHGAKLRSRHCSHHATVVKVTKRAQLEIMGLVVVVILISLGFLFALQFAVLRAPENPRETFTREQVAQNTLHTLVLTTTRCHGLSMTELMQDCFDSLSDLDCNGKTSCEFAGGVTSSILNETLKTWERSYDFTLVRGDLTKVQLKHKGCPNDRDVGRMFLPSRDGGDKILVRLDVCD